MKLKMFHTRTDSYFYRIRRLFGEPPGPTILRFSYDTEYQVFYLLAVDDEEYRHRNSPLKKL